MQPRSSGRPTVLRVSKNTSEGKKQTNNKKLQSWAIPFHFGCESRACFVFIQSVNIVSELSERFQFELVNYCIVTHLFKLLNKTLVSRTFLPVYRITSISINVC